MRGESLDERSKKEEKRNRNISLVTPASSSQDHDMFIKLTKTQENTLTTTPQRTPCDKSSHEEDQRVAGITRGGGADEEKGWPNVHRPSAWMDSPGGHDSALTAACSTASSQDDDSKGTKTRCTSVMTQKPQTASPVVNEKTGNTENPNAECAGPMRSVDSSHEPPAKLALEVPVERRVSEASREVEDGLGEDSDEEHQPWIADEPPGEPRVKSGGPIDVEVEPGSEIAVEQNGSTAHTDMDTTADGRAEEAHPDVEDETERLTTH